MVIEEDDIEEALEVCQSLSSTARQVAGMEGKSSLSSMVKSFLVIMSTAPNHTLSRKQVLQKGFGDFDANELDKIIETLTQTGYVVQPTGGKDITYRMTKTFVDLWDRTTKVNK